MPPTLPTACVSARRRARPWGSGALQLPYSPKRDESIGSVMSAMAHTLPAKDDPRYLRAMMDLAGDLSRDLGMATVFVGIAGQEGDLLVPEFLEFVESALRMDDRIFRLLRERAVLLLVDVDVAQATSIVDRLRSDFVSRYGPSARFDIDIRYLPMEAGLQSVTVKDVLPTLFAEGD